MKLRRLRFLNCAAKHAVILVILAVSYSAAWSQVTNTIKILVPSPPGGPADILARLLGEEITRVHGTTIVIENRAGAGGRIGTEAVSRAAPDGRTLLIAANPFIIDPHVRKANYDPIGDFEPICYLARQPTVVVVNSASPYRGLADLLDAARGRPGELTLASTGPATATQLAFEMLKHNANVDMTFVPYAGAAPAVNAALGAHVASALVPYPTVVEHLKTGKLRALAAASRQRIASLPEVPTIGDSGYKDIEADLWNALFAPAKTPKETVSELTKWFTAALKVPDIEAKLVIQSMFPVGMCGAKFGAYLREQYDEYGRIVREANIKAD